MIPKPIGKHFECPECGDRLQACMEIVPELKKDDTWILKQVLVCHACWFKAWFITDTELINRFWVPYIELEED